MRYSLHDCKCSVDEPYADGSLPEFYDVPIRAMVAYRKHKLVSTLYWGVHLNGLHLTTKHWR